MAEFNQDLFYDVLAGAEESKALVELLASDYIVPMLIALFGIAVAFVAYKLIKRALNKA